MYRTLLNLFSTGLFFSSSCCSTGIPKRAASYPNFDYTTYYFLSWAAIYFSTFYSPCLCFFSSYFCNFSSFFCLAFSSFYNFLSLTFILPVFYYWDSCYCVFNSTSSKSWLFFSSSSSDGSYIIWFILNNTRGPTFLRTFLYTLSFIRPSKVFSFCSILYSICLL